MNRKTLQRLLAGMLVAVVMLCTLPTDALATLIKVQVTAEYANVYKSPSTTSVVLRKPPQGSVMTCAATKGEWCYVKYDGTVGYVLKCKLTTNVTTSDDSSAGDSTVGDTSDETTAETTPTPTPSQGTSSGTTSSTSGIKVVTTANSKLYKRADAASGSYGTIPKGKTIICTKTSGIWARVEAAGLTGYVLKSNLRSAGSSSSSGSSSSGSGSSGSSSSTSATRVICYIKKDVTLYSSASADSSAIASLKTGDKVLVVQVKNGWGKMYTTSGALGYVPSSYLSKTKVNKANSVQLKDWFDSDIQEIFAVGSTAKVIDVATGKSFSIKRKGGLYHADCETLSTSDTKTMLAVYGGEWSWDRRAIWVVINGVYYAASMNGMGHGEETVLSNNLEGHFCIHFLNSRTHGTNKVCPLHQACVKAAYAAGN